MRYIYLSLILLITFFAAGQGNKIKQAVFFDCANMPEPEKCTFFRFKDDVWQLFKKNTEKQLTENNDAYLNLAVRFISNESGTVIEDEIEVLCSNDTLKEAVTDYIKKLRFIPKDASLQERRSVHSYTITFIKNDFNEGYHIALPEEIREKGIKPDLIPLDEYPVFKGCKEAVNDKNNVCISEKLREYILKNYKTPRTSRAMSLRMYISFYVDEEGEIKIDKIAGGVDPYAKEVHRVMEKAPRAIPGKVNGIPVKVSFTLPLIINIR